MFDILIAWMQKYFNRIVEKFLWQQILKEIILFLNFNFFIQKGKNEIPKIDLFYLKNFFQNFTMKAFK